LVEYSFVPGKDIRIPDSDMDMDMGKGIKDMVDDWKWKETGPN
jgi:hypothetical protein